MQMETKYFFTSDKCQPPFSSVEGEIIIIILYMEQTYKALQTHIKCYVTAVLLKLYVIL